MNWQNLFFSCDISKNCCDSISLKYEEKKWFILIIRKVHKWYIMLKNYQKLTTQIFVYFSATILQRWQTRSTECRYIKVFWSFSTVSTLHKRVDFNFAALFSKYLLNKSNEKLISSEMTRTQSFMKHETMIIKILNELKKLQCWFFSTNSFSSRKIISSNSSFGQI